MSKYVPHNNLEEYLNDVYRKECKFIIADEEVKFIQTGIEKLSIKFVEKILAYAPSAHDTDVARELQRQLQEDFNSFKSDGGEVWKCEASDIIRVGSFYEGTRNKYPDEFDLIFPVYVFSETKELSRPLVTTIVSILNKTYAIISKQTSEPVLTPEEKKLLREIAENSSREVFYDKVVGKTGPAWTLQFVYQNHEGVTRNIHVDLVPAGIVTDKNIERIAINHCELEPFQTKIKETGRVLMVQQRVSFTETEVEFMRNLSPNHKKVYRLLKYFTHGHDDTFDKGFSLPIKDYSSYILKNFIIYHHFKCLLDAACVGQCLLNVLEEMCKYETTDNLPTLANRSKSFREEKSRKLVLLPHLKKLKSYLWTTSNESYSYDEMKVPKSLAAQHKDRGLSENNDEFSESDNEKMQDMADFAISFQ